MDVALIRLGQMGSGMAANLLAAGHQVTVWNRDRTKAERFAALGATVAADLAEAARANIVMTMLADDAAIEAVVFGNGGLLAAGSGLLHVSRSTVSVDLAGRLAAAHAAQPLFDAIGAGTHRVGNRAAMAAAAKLAFNAGIPAITQMMTEQFRIVATPPSEKAKCVF
jgi:3-hydroxyisobutyrate dehydrogenase-like beta-hydroxyacid dehydrogenase